MQVIFRLAEKQDTPELLLMVESFHNTEGLAFNLEKITQSITPLLSINPLGCIWLVLVNENIVGYIVLTFGYSIEFNGRDAFIDEFFIKPNHRNQGLGKSTLEYVRQHAAAYGIHAIHLEVDRHNKANRLYQAAGFKPRNRYVMMSTEVED